jgi:hypothetical protein
MSNGNAGNQPIAVKQAFWIGALGGISPLAARGAGHRWLTGTYPHYSRVLLITYALALLPLFGLGGVISVFTDDPASRTFRFAATLSRRV